MQNQEIEFTEFLAPELAESLAEEQEKLLSECRTLRIIQKGDTGLRKRNTRFCRNRGFYRPAGQVIFVRDERKVGFFNRYQHQP